MDENGSGDKVLDSLVVIMAIVLFFGTAAVMSTFAPQMLSDIVGFDTAYLYGVVAAICVEWGALRLHFNPNARKNVVANWVKWMLLAVSGLCQVYNAGLETGNLPALSETLKIGFTFFVPNIPLLFIVLMFWIGSLGRNQKGWLDRLQDKGIRNKLPDPKAMWRGRESSELSQSSPTEVVRTNLDEELPKSNNGQEKKVVNPTSRQP